MKPDAKFNEARLRRGGGGEAYSPGARPSARARHDEAAESGSMRRNGHARAAEEARLARLAYQALLVKRNCDLDQDVRRRKDTAPSVHQREATAAASPLAYLGGASACTKAP